MKVTLATLFAKRFLNFPKQDQEKIRTFIEHVENYGLADLQGRNKSSDNVPTDNLNYLAKVNYAQQHKLWHYHIGIPDYETASNGEQVSEYILYYQYFDDEIKIVAMSYHPPFELPTEDELNDD